MWRTEVCQQRRRLCQKGTAICVIRVDFKSLWRTPVLVIDDTGRIVKIRSSEDALRKLDVVSPRHENSARRFAKSACLAAIRDEISSEHARELFVEARYQDGRLLP